MRALKRELQGRRFDALLQMQVAARANLLSAFLPAQRRIGYDRSRSKDLHGMFINERIPDRPGIHVLDAIGSFCEPLGLKQTEAIWEMPVPDDASEWARAQWPDDSVPTLAISPCSSHALRNWRPERYAAVADHAAARGWRVVLLGGRSALERGTSDAILAAMTATTLALAARRLGRLDR
jgi:heptosyltransferase I